MSLPRTELFLAALVSYSAFGPALVVCQRGSYTYADGRGLLKTDILRIRIFCRRCRVLCSILLRMICPPQSFPVHPCPSPGSSALGSKTSLSSTSFPSQSSFARHLVCIIQNQSSPSEHPTFFPASSYSPPFLPAFTFSISTGFQSVSPSCGSSFTVSAVPHPTASLSQSGIPSQFPNSTLPNAITSLTPP